MARKLLEQLRRWADAEDDVIERERKRRRKRLNRERRIRRLSYRLVQRLREEEE